ncbi:MAG: hypothetical protein LBO77_02050 [Desulfovibrio sp.]|jgi:hypothetical protein|nr:hypothetical protein [Desulfovibrio sp.]
MPVFHKRLFGAGVLLLALFVLFLRFSREREEPPPADAAAFIVFRDPGALQDEKAPLLPLPPETGERYLQLLANSGAGAPRSKIATLSGNEIPPDDSPQPVVEGRSYYSPYAPSLAWAAKETLRGPYRRYLPAPLPEDFYEYEREKAFAVLDHAEALAAASEAGSPVSRRYYAYALRLLNLLSLRRAGDAGIQAARAQALNGLARTLPANDGFLAFTLAAGLAGTAPPSSASLTQWGMALLGLALPEKGARREELLALAEKKLRFALSLKGDLSAPAYALAQAAALRNDRKEAAAMLLRASRGDAPVSRLRLSTEPAFSGPGAAPWLEKIARAFPPSPLAPTPAQENAVWLARELGAAEPGRKDISFLGWVRRLLSPSGARDAAAWLELGRKRAGSGDRRGSAFPLAWAHRLASSYGWAADAARRDLMYTEIHRLFSLAQEAAHPPLTAGDYLAWGDALTNWAVYSEWTPSLRTLCSGDVRPWAEKALAAYGRAAELDRSSEDVFQSLRRGYALVLSCPDGQEREMLLEARQRAFLAHVPADAAAMARMAEAWAYDLAEWAEESLSVPGQRRLQEGVFRLEQALARAEEEGDEQAAALARLALAGFKLHLASLASDGASRDALLAGAEADAGAGLAALPSARVDLISSNSAFTLCLALARAFDSDAEKKRRYAGEALLRLSQAEELGKEEDPADLGRVLEQMGMAERNPEDRRELFYLAAALFHRALEDDPRESGIWNAWGVALSRLAQTVAQEEGREAILLTARDVFLWEEALRPGGEAYNIACIYSLLGRFEECRRWLERAGNFRALPSRLHMQTDTDMDPVRLFPWFAKILPPE